MKRGMEGERDLSNRVIDLIQVYNNKSMIDKAAVN